MSAASVEPSIAWIYKFVVYFSLPLFSVAWKDVFALTQHALQGNLFYLQIFTSFFCKGTSRILELRASYTLYLQLEYDAQHSPLI